MYSVGFILEKVKQNKIICVPLFVILSLFYFNPALYAQTKSTINGTVKLKDETYLQSATVLLLKANDSTLIKTAITDKEGNFFIAGKLSGIFFLRITHNGIKTHHSEPFSITETKPNYNAGIIYTDTYNKNLQEVQVETKKPFIELNVDKVVLNISGNSINAGATAMEVLERAPGLTVDELSGRININGKQGTLVMINGKPTYLSTADLAILLKSTPSSQLDKIEIITNPSSRYDAAGNTGIINLRMVKNQREGFNGNYTASVSQGNYFKVSNSLSFNYRRKNLNLYGNYGVQRRTDFTTINFTKEFSGSTPPVKASQFSFRKFLVIPQTYNAGLDYFINKNTTLGVWIRGSATRLKSPQENNTSFFSNGNSESVAKTNAFTRDNSSNLSLNANLKKTLDTAGKEINLDIDYSRFQKNNSQEFTTDFFNAAGIQQFPSYMQAGETPSFVDIKAIRMDFINPITKKRKIEAGVKISKVVSDNFPQFYKISGGTSIPDSSQTNHFVYSETILAAYAGFRKEYKQTSFQAGLRIENTVGSGKQKITNINFKRNYLQLFPSLFFQHQVSENHNLSMAYGRRIDRPNYQDLNPFSLFLDQYSLWRGNPELGPQFTNNIELSHQYKKTLITKLNYTRSDKVISDVLKQIDTSRISIQTKENINTFINFGISATAFFSPAKWWSVNLSLHIYQNEYKGVFLNQAFIKNQGSFLCSFSNSLKLSPQVNADINSYYQAKALSGIEESVSKHSLSVGLRRTSKNKRTTIQFNVSDVFRGQRGGGLTKIANINTSSVVRYDSRVLRLSFNCRFGKNTVTGNRRRETGVEEEKGRVGN